MICHRSRISARRDDAYDGAGLGQVRPSHQTLLSARISPVSRMNPANLSAAAVSADSCARPDSVWSRIPSPDSGFALAGDSGSEDGLDLCRSQSAVVNGDFVDGAVKRIIVAGVQFVRSRRTRQHCLRRTPGERVSRHTRAPTGPNLIPHFPDSLQKSMLVTYNKAA
jgi:hypothetical protein